MRRRAGRSQGRARIARRGRRAGRDPARQVKRASGTRLTAWLRAACQCAGRRRRTHRACPEGGADRIRRPDRHHGRIAADASVRHGHGRNTEGPDMNAPSPSAATPRSEGGIGHSIVRREDDRFLIGRARYMGDIAVVNALHAVFVRSPHAHAKINRIEESAALRVPGVVAVWTGADMARAATTLRVAPPIEGLKPVDLPPFPVHKVRFAGDLVACVVAETRAAALDGAEAVAVDYDALASVPDIATARLSSSAPVDPEYQSNLISHQSFAAGGVEAAFCRAPRIVEARFA